MQSRNTAGCKYIHVRWLVLFVFFVVFFSTIWFRRPSPLALPKHNCPLPQQLPSGPLPPINSHNPFFVRSDTNTHTHTHTHTRTHARTKTKTQVCFFSATLHSPEIAKLADTLCDRPTWVDLKGRDTVPQTVHHVVVRVDPDKDGEVDAVLGRAKVQARTDGAAVGAGSEGREAERAERLKRMKPQVRGQRAVSRRPTLCRGGIVEAGWPGERFDLLRGEDCCLRVFAP